MTKDEIRAAIREAQDITIEPVPTPEWPVVNGQVHVRTLNLAARDAYLASIRENDVVDVNAAGVKLVVVAACDSNGEPIFTTEDVEVLAKKGWSAVQRLQDAAARLNGLTKTARVDAKNELPSATI